MSNTEASMGMSLDDLIKSSKKLAKVTRPKLAPGKKAKGKGATAMSVDAKKKKGATKLVTIKKAIGKAKPTKNDLRASKLAAKRLGGKLESGEIETGIKLFISNLDFRVTKQDLRELFRDFGSIKFADVHYNAGGRSQGTGDVVFHNKKDGLKAMREYNGRTLDGRPLQIQALQPPPPTVRVTSRLGAKKMTNNGTTVTVTRKKGRGRR